MGKALLWLLAALLGVSLCCILLLGTAALLDNDDTIPVPIYLFLILHHRFASFCSIINVGVRLTA